ncbi:MAG: hypothetical protein ACKOZW_05365, partial [Cyanobium sp.]
PFTLLGTALLLLSERQMSRMAKPVLSAKRLHKLTRLASIGFLLLIPLLIHGIWTQIRTADFAAQATIRNLERRVNAVRSTGSSSELITLSVGLPADWQPRANDSLAANRARLLGRVEPELARLRTNVDQRKREAIQMGLKEGSKNTLLSLIYAWALAGVRHRLLLPDSFDDSFDASFDEPEEHDFDTSMEEAFDASQEEAFDASKAQAGRESERFRSNAEG